MFGWYIPGLWAMMLGILAVRAHIVESRLFIVYWLGLTSMILNALLNYLLIGPFGLKGLAMASSLVWWIVPMAYLLALWPTVRGHIQWVAWCRVVLIVTLSGTTASVIEYTGNTPTSIGDPALWGAALLCFALLGLASLWAGKPRGVSV